MKITVRAAGLIKSGPERLLIDDYLKRANVLARGLGLTGIAESAFDTRSAKSKSESTKLVLSPIDTAQILVVLDERGKDLTSRQIAKAIATWRDDGHKNVTIAIGAADGFEKSLLPANAQIWRLGAQTWPHKLARVMIFEQIYRALSILARTPYHRD